MTFFLSKAFSISFSNSFSHYDRNEHPLGFFSHHSSWNMFPLTLVLFFPLLTFTWNFDQCCYTFYAADWLIDCISNLIRYLIHLYPLKILLFPLVDPFFFSFEALSKWGNSLLLIPVYFIFIYS